MPRSSTQIDEILDRAATQSITAEELEILVNKTRELSIARERELKHLRELLAALEAKQDRN